MNPSFNYKPSKTYNTAALLLLLLVLPLFLRAQQSVTIGDTQVKTNAVLYLKGNGAQGLIIPVTDDPNSVPKNAGMIVFNSVDAKVYSCDGTTWTALGSTGTGTGSGNFTLTLSGNNLLLKDGTTTVSTVPLASTAPATANQFLMWDGTTWIAATLTQDVSVTNGVITVNGLKTKAIPSLPTSGVQALTYDASTSTWKFQTLAAAGTGTVTQVITGTGLTGGPITTTGTIAVDVGTAANKIVQLDVAGKLPAVDGSQLTNLPSSATSLNGLSDVTISGSPGTGQTLVNDGAGQFKNVILSGDVTGITAAGAVTIAPITSTKITDGTIAAVDLATGAVTSTTILDGTISAADLATSSVTTTQITDGTIATADLASGAVTAAKLANTAVTPAAYGSATQVPQFTVDAQGRLTAAANVAISAGATTLDGLTDATVTSPATGQVLIYDGTSQFKNLTLSGDITGVTNTGAVTIASITSSKITDGTIAAVDLATGAVTSTTILDGTVAAADLATSSVTTTQITDGTIATADLASGAVTAAKLANTAVTPAAYGSATQVPQFTVDAQGRLTAAANVAISAGATTLDGLTDATVTSPATGQVLIYDGTSQFKNLTLSGDITGVTNTGAVTIASITSSKITDGTIAAADLATGAVTSTIILDGTIAAADLATGSVTTTQITDGTIVDTDVSTTAAIAGVKIKPDFGSQDISTTGKTVLNSITYTWPGSQAASTFLANDGAGGLTWTSAGSALISNPGTNNLFAGIGAGAGNTGQNNSFFGAAAGQATSTAINNSFFGAGAGQANTSGTENTFIGRNAGVVNTTGNWNVYVGKDAGKAMVTGNLNTMVGYQAGHNANGVSASTFLGNVAGGGTISGDFNTFLGESAGLTNTTGSNNTMVGKNADVGSGALSNATAIGYNTTVNASNCLVLGNGANVGIGISSPVAKFQVTGGSILSDGVTGNTPVSGSGTRFMWIPSQSAIRAGSVISTEWDNANIGAGSAAFGTNNTASGDASTAIGQANISSGFRSFAGGVSSTAVGNGSTALGEGVTASTRGGFAVGHYNVGGGSATTFTATDPVFEVGIGASSASKANALTVLHGGNVGIGTTAPASPLNVAGSTTGFLTRVEQSGSGHGLLSYVNTSSSAQTVFSASGNLTGLSVLGDGKVGIGSTPTYRFHVFHANGSPAAGDGLTIQNIGANNQNWSFFVSNTSGVLQLYDNNTFAGSFAAASGTYTAVSDRRLKKNITTIENILPKINAMQIRRYHFKKQNDSEPTNIGVIAQELKELFPELVKYSSENDRFSVDYSGIAPLAIKAIQEQQDIINDLKKQVDQLANNLKKEQEVNASLSSKMETMAEDIDYIRRNVGLDKKAKKETKKETKK